MAMAYPPQEVQYERVGPVVNNARRGPLRFEEGVATDTDIPNEFGRGAYADGAGDHRGRSFTIRKDPVETTRERAHVGSATWIEAPTMLSDFVYGAQAGQGMPEFELEYGSEQRLVRISPTTVID
jgi:hypothetical protein